MHINYTEFFREIDFFLQNPSKDNTIASTMRAYARERLKCDEINQAVEE